MGRVPHSSRLPRGHSPWHCSHRGDAAWGSWQLLSALPGGLRRRTCRRRLDQLVPILARGIHPMGPWPRPRAWSSTPRPAWCSAGTVALRRFLASAIDALLAAGSDVLDAARAAISERPGVHVLPVAARWPARAGRPCPRDRPDEARTTCRAVLTGIVLLSPAGDLRGLTPRELEVLGLVVDGCSNLEIARELVVAPRTVAAHLKHILVKLGAPSRTLAAVRAERAGLYVPAGVGACGRR